jgi:hypothetical protein
LGPAVVRELYLACTRACEACDHEFSWSLVATVPGTRAAISSPSCAEAPKIPLGKQIKGFHNVSLKSKLKENNLLKVPEMPLNALPQALGHTSLARARSRSLSLSRSLSRSLSQGAKHTLLLLHHHHHHLPTKYGTLRAYCRKASHASTVEPSTRLYKGTSLFTSRGQQLRGTHAQHALTWHLHCSARGSRCASQPRRAERLA